MNRKIVVAGMALSLLLAAGCSPSTKSGRGFHLPPGNAERDKAAFMQLKCNACHTVEGVELAAPAEKRTLLVHLGGEVARLRTYGQLVTAIIHPARDISEKFSPADQVAPGKSPMRDLTGEMTVAQLIDIVTFLEPTYRAHVAVYTSPTE